MAIDGKFINKVVTKVQQSVSAAEHNDKPTTSEKEPTKSLTRTWFNAARAGQRKIAATKRSGDDNRSSSTRPSTRPSGRSAGRILRSKALVEKAKALEGTGARGTGKAEASDDPIKINTADVIKGGREKTIADLKKQKADLKIYDEALQKRIHELNAGAHIPESRAESKKLEIARKAIEKLSDVVDVRLENQRHTQFAINMAHAWGANTETAQKLTNMNIEIERSTELGLDAEYDTAENKVTISKDMINENVKKAYTYYVEKKAIDPDTGTILKPDVLKSGAFKHDIAVFYSLASHEAVHYEQDKAGTDETHAAKLRALGTKIKREMFIAQKMDGFSTPKETLKKSFTTRLANEYLKLEHPAYNRQELDQHALGEAPRKFGWMTIDNSGKNLPQEQAVKNIRDFLRQDSSYRELEAELFAELVEGKVHDDHGHDLQTDVGGRKSPGRKSPGRKSPGRKSPGEILAGEDLAGRKSPGRKSPGRKSPGRKSPGSELGGAGTE